MKSENMETEKLENIDRLIASFLAQKATDQDIELLEKWLQVSEANQSYFNQIQNIWEGSDNEFNIDEKKTTEAFRKIDERISKPASKIHFLKYLQRIAAIALIPLVIGSYLLGGSSKIKKEVGKNEIVYNEVFAAYGTRSSLKLADGSQVWLNSGSSLRYPVQFIDNERKVFLKGEAYFEVQSDLKRPFIVQTQALSVKATGTKFNVQAFSTNSSTEVTLVEGKVTVSKSLNPGNPIFLNNMKPNEHLRFDSISGQTQVNEEDVYKYISWKDGKLIFRNEKLSEVVKKIGQLYNVEIEIQGKSLQEYRYRATFEEETIDDIMKLLKLSSPVEYKEMSRKPDAYGTFPKKKFIIYPSKNSEK